MLLPALATRYFYNPFIDTVEGRVYLPARLSTAGFKKKKKGLVVLCTAVCKQLTVHSFIPFHWDSPFFFVRVQQSDARRLTRCWRGS